MKSKIKPSAKIKRRYLLLSDSTKKEAEQAILDFIGILGWAKASPLFPTTKSNKLILAIERSSLLNVKAAFELTNKIKVKKVSGTLSGLKN
jgi:RNase P/RNase MRP subunit POP5